MICTESFWNIEINTETPRLVLVQIADFDDFNPIKY